MSSLLTVVVPVFNDETNISRCLESLFNQSFKNMEIIVVNDASTDNTGGVLAAYQQKYEFQTINMKENSGAACCRNVGLMAAKTPYVTFLDSDDWVDISTYTKCFEQISSNPDIIIFGLSYDYPQINHRDIKYHYPSNYKMFGEFALRIYTHTIPNEIKITPIVNNKIYRRKFLIENRIAFNNKLRYQEDDVFTFEALALANIVAFVSGCYYHYCQRSDSLIHTISEAAIHGFCAAYLSLASELEKRHLFEKYKNEYYLKMKSSLLGLVKRILDYETDTKRRNSFLQLLIFLIIDNFNVPDILETFNFSLIRSIL